MRAKAHWLITVRYFVRWPFKTALPFSGIIVGDPHALLGSMFLDISAVSGLIFLKQT